MHRTKVINSRLKAFWTSSGLPTGAVALALCLLVLGLGWRQADQFAARTASTQAHIMSLRFQKQMGLPKPAGAQPLLAKKEHLGLASALPQSEIVLVDKGVFRPDGKHVRSWLAAPLQELKNLRPHEHKVWWADENGQPKSSISGASWLIYGTPLNKQKALFVIYNLAQEKAFVSAMQNLLWWFLPLALAAIAAISWLSFRRFESEVQHIGDFLSSVRSTDNLKDPLEAGNSPGLALLTDEINHMLTRIDQNMKALEDVTGQLAHVLRTPLQDMMEVLEDIDEEGAGNGDAEWKKGIAAILRYRDTYDLLIDIAILKAGGGKLSVRDLGELVNAVAASAEGGLAKKNISISIKTMPGCRVPERRGQGGIVLQNLFTNAQKYTQDGGRIKLELERCDATCRLTISNNPCLPVEPDEVAQLGDKCFRAQSAQELHKQNGFGLGLTFIKTYMDSVEGSAEFTVEEDSFVVVLNWPLSGGDRLDVNAE